MARKSKQNQEQSGTASGYTGSSSALTALNRKKRASDRKKRRQSAARQTASKIYLCIAIVVIAAAIVAATTLFFRIRTVTVSGNAIYSAEEVREASGLQIGQNLLVMDKFRVIEGMLDQLPYLKDVTIRRRFPVRTSRSCSLGTW